MYKIGDVIPHDVNEEVPIIFDLVNIVDVKFEVDNDGHDIYVVCEPEKADGKAIIFKDGYDQMVIISNKCANREMLVDLI